MYTDQELKTAHERTSQVLKLSRAVLREQEMRDVDLHVVALVVSKELSSLRESGELRDDAGESGSEAEEETIIDILSGKPLEKRSLLQKIRYRKPFSSMGKNGYAAAKRRVETMISGGVIIVNSSGSLEVV